MYWEDTFRNRTPAQQGRKQLFQRKKSSKTAPRKAFLLFIFLVAQLIFYSCDLFKLQEITVRGNNKTRTDEILKAAAFPLGKNLFEVSLRGVGERLMKLHWLKRIAAEKHYPSSIRIHVTERTPVLRARSVSRPSEKPCAVDEDGIVLEAAPDNALPLVYVPEEVRVGERISKERIAAALACYRWISDADRPFVLSVLVDRRFSITVSYDYMDNPTEIYLGQERNLTARTGKILAAMLKWCEDRGKPVKYLNLKYPDKPALLFKDAKKETSPIIHAGIQ
jgi:cell division protein FtsQ